MKKAFTLVEVTIYFGILAALSLPILVFLWNVIYGNLKATSFLEVKENASFSLMKISKKIKSAKKIISPLPGETGSTLSLLMEDPKLNPTVFDLFEGKLRMTQKNEIFFLTSDNMTVEKIIFKNLSYPETPGVVRIELEIRPKGSSWFQIPKIEFKTTTSLRPS